MDFTRITTPSSIPVHDHTRNHGRRRSTSRSAGLPFSSRPSGPMAIPNTSHDLAPPPLPPPRFINDITAGSDPGWQWGNNSRGKFGKAEPPPASGGTFPKSWNTDMEENRPPQRSQHLRRDSSNSTVKSPPDAERRYRDFAKHQDEGYYSLSGPRSSAMSQQSVYTSKSPRISRLRSLGLLLCTFMDSSLTCSIASTYVRS